MLLRDGVFFAEQFEDGNAGLARAILIIGTILANNFNHVKAPSPPLACPQFGSSVAGGDSAHTWDSEGGTAKGKKKYSP